jgi:hypothetical protein
MGSRYAFLQFVGRPPRFGDDYFGFVCKASAPFVHWHRAMSPSPISDDRLHPRKSPRINKGHPVTLVLTHNEVIE